MVAEEIEIVVTAKVEEALREFKKMLPEIKKQMGQVQQEFSKVDMKDIARKVQPAMQQVKQKIGEIKGTNVDKTLQKQFERASTSVMGYRQQLEQTKEQLKQVYAQMDVKQEKTWKQYTPDGIALGNKGIEPAVNKALGADKEYQKLITQEAQLNQKIQELNQKLQQAKQNYKSIGAEVGQTQAKQNIFTNMAGKVNNVLQSMKSKMSGVSNTFNKLPNITAKINANIKQMSTGMKQGLGHILRYAGALFSLRGIYSILSSSASSWLNSQNAGAQQLKTNIEYMKNAMGSALASVIQWITNLIYNLMKAIQSVVYALFRVNIFAKASAKSYASMAGSAKKAKNETKSLAGVHDEINNVSKNDNADSGGSGSGTGTPSFDLSGIDNQMSPLAQKLYEFFKPLKESWDIYGPALIEQIKTTASQIGYLLSSVWGSFENIITNGTVYTTLELILAIIGNIAEAFANAWNNNGIGNTVVQDVFNTLNNILSIINQIAQSTGFQNLLNSALKILDNIVLTIDNIATAFGNAWNYNGNGDTILTTIGNILEKISNTIRDISGSEAFQTFLNGVSTAFAGILQFIEPVLTDFLEIAKPIAEIALSTIGTILETVGNALSWIGSNEIAVTILESIALAIGLVTVATKLFSIEKLKETGILIANAAAWVAANLPIILITAAIAAVIAIIILCVKHWDEIKEKVIEVVGKIKEKAGELKDEVVQKITEMKDKVVEKFTNIKDKDKEIGENIKNTFKEKIDNLKNNLSNTLNNIKTNWDNIMNGLRTTVSNVWNGIWRYN